MKIFISHKMEDEPIARRVGLHLWMHNIPYYLDALDKREYKDAKELTEHIKAAVNSCTDILVVMSMRTRLSQWVPFEIGLSSQLNMPAVTYLSQNVPLPEFLACWPRLRDEQDIERYIRIRQETRQQMERRNGNYSYWTNQQRQDEMWEFYSNLKRVL